MDKVILLALILAVSRTCLGVQVELNKNDVDLIVGGEKASIGEAPYQVIIFINGDDDVHCSGSIISKRTVVSAGHCFYENRRPKDYYVVAGTNFLNKTGGLSYKVFKIVVHEHFHMYLNASNDISLVLLDREVEFSNLIKTIKFDEAEFLDPIEVKVTGWGSTDGRDGTSSPYLKKLVTKTLTREECMKPYEGLKSRDDNMICTRTEKNQGGCTGDSGGPLVTKVNEEVQLVGIVSFGDFDCGSGVPDVDTRVSSFVDWIEKNGIF